MHIGKENQDEFFEKFHSVVTTQNRKYHFGFNPQGAVSLFLVRQPLVLVLLVILQFLQGTFELQLRL